VFGGPVRVVVLHGGFQVGSPHVLRERAKPLREGVLVGPNVAAVFEVARAAAGGGGRCFFVQGRHQLDEVLVQAGAVRDARDVDFVVHGVASHTRVRVPKAQRVHLQVRKSKNEGRD